MIYKFRLILDAEEDVIRDIAIESGDSLEGLHNTITQAFGFAGNEMASFYTSDDEWNQGDEISLFDLSDDASGSVRLMHNTTIDSVVNESENKLIYVYDFMSMWTFFVEMVETG